MTPKVKTIPVYEPLLDGNEQRYVAEAIASGWISSEGPFVEQFERQWAYRVERRYGIAVSSGTLALQIAFAALDLPPGSEVILPTFTIISCILAVIRCGLTPVLVDSDPHTFNMDVSEVETKITANTRAILMVHTYGLPCDVTKISALANQHNLILIEDAAQMHGQTYQGEPCGGFGDISIFSFYANKLVTTGEGGMVVTDDLSLSLRCRQLRDLDHEPGQRFLHRSLAWNARMTNLQAAVGCAQLERLSEFVTLKRRMGATYDELLCAVPNLQLPVPGTEYANNIYWAYTIVIDREWTWPADVVSRALREKGIDTRRCFVPLHQQHCVQPFIDQGPPQEINEATPSRYPVADRLNRCGLYLPGGLTLTQSDQMRIADALKEILT